MSVFKASVLMAASLVLLFLPYSSGVAIGIDLGTTYSCAAVYQNGGVQIIPNDQGNRITPSWVAFTETGERLVGEAAKNQATSNIENTVYDAKRLIGRLYDDPLLQADLRQFPFRVISKESKPMISMTRLSKDIVMS